jgi:hypothetical protein
MLGVYFLGKYNIGNKPMAGYDAKKAELYNRLRQQGLSEDAAAAQAGIGANDYNYEVNQVGTPATNPNYGKLQPISIRAKDPNAPPAPTADQLAEEAALNAELAEPPTKSSIKGQIYTTTSTETVSGGGSTTRIVNPSQPTPASQALQPALDAKQAELDQFNKDNPSNFARKRQGLPPLTPEENQARLAQQSKLVDEESQLRSQQKSLESGGGVTTVTVPNTTTTTTTVTTSTSPVDTPVQSPGGADTKVNQQTEAQLGASAAATGGVTPAADPVPSTAEYSRATADAEVAAYGVEPAPVPPPTAEQIAAEDLAVYPNRAVSVEERERITQEEIAASDLEVYPRDVPSEEDAGLYDQQQAILAAQAEQKQQDQYGGYGGASEAENNALTQAMAENARQQQTIAGQRKTQNNGDWRVRLRLAPRADYLYMAPAPGILQPLADSDGVIFPYTPQISMGYRANYGTADLTHSNYRGYFYQNSYVEAVNLKCTFTAQSTAEANYLLAVIHFFRSVTKMFYGQDPQRGAPPPLVYLSGLGQYQFNENPCVVSSFDYTLPGDVDYIRAGSSNMNQTNMQNLRPRETGGTSSVGAFGALLGGALDRLSAAGVNKGAVNSTPPTPNFGLGNPTYVPTKLEISITLFPMQSRTQISQQFSVRDFANGKLLKSGGFW